MNVKCTKCGTVNSVGPSQPGQHYLCGKCATALPPAPKDAGDTSAAVGLLGGAALGAAMAGPPGALVGAILGAVLGKTAKGVG